MNRIQIIGLILLIIGIVLQLSPFSNDGISFIIGFLVGSGTILLISGRIMREKKEM